MASQENTLSSNPRAWSEAELAFFDRQVRENDPLKWYQDPYFKANSLHLQQVKARQIITRKVPDWLSYPLFYPPSVHLEQASSEACAAFRASLLPGTHGLDATLGLGVDTWAIARAGHQVLALEPAESLARITRHNLNLLGCHSVRILAGESLETWLEKATDEQFDWIYVDPSRRNQSGARVTALDDTYPKLSPHWDALWRHSRNIFLKTSVWLDVQQTARQLPGVRAVYVLSLHQECRELFWVLEHDYQGTFEIHAVELDRHHFFHVHTSHETEKQQTIEYVMPETYLFEPAPALLKAGLFRYTAAHFGLKKLHPNTHLYTGSHPVESFPGRQFKIDRILPVDGKELSRHIPERHANLSIRNFPGRVDELRKRLRLQDGGKVYLWATTLCDARKVLILTHKIP